MQNKLMQQIGTLMPRINMNTVKHFAERSVDEIPEFLQEAMIAAVDTLASCGITDFKYLGYSLSAPRDNLHRLLVKRPYQRVFQINETYSVECIFKFQHEGVVYEKPIEIPFCVNGRIRLNGVDNYPMKVITDRGGISRMKDSLYMETMRVTMIYIRDKLSSRATIEGPLMYASIIRTQQHYGKNGTRKEPPLLLYLFALKGFDETLELLGASGMISIVQHVKHGKGILHIPIREDAYIRVKGYQTDNLVARIAFSIIDILGVYSTYSFEDLTTMKYYRIALGAFTQAGMLDKDDLEAHATSHLIMCENSLDAPSKRLHASIGISYRGFTELVELMFTEIDDLLLHLKRNRINVYEKRICGTHLLMTGAVQQFHNDLYQVLNSKTEQTRVGKIKRLMNPQSFSSSLHSTETFDYVSTQYNDNIMPYLLRRKLVLHSSDLKSSRGSGKFRKRAQGTIPVEFLRFHSSYPLTMAMFTYPSSRPISTGSMLPFVSIDEEGNIETPDYWEQYNNLYGDNPK